MVKRYIFNADVEEAFFSKLDSLHDKYVYHLLLSGVAPVGANLESIKMTKNPETSEKYCERVVGGFLNIKPQIIVKFIEDKKTKLECIFTHINNNRNLNLLYMIQNVVDWPKLGHFSCQVWYLGDTTLFEVNEHWNKFK